MFNYVGGDAQISVWEESCNRRRTNLLLSPISTTPNLNILFQPDTSWTTFKLLLNQCFPQVPKACIWETMMMWCYSTDPSQRQDRNVSNIVPCSSNSPTAAIVSILNFLAGGTNRVSSMTISTGSPVSGGWFGSTVWYSVINFLSGRAEVNRRNSG
jgi:hypothetical protein